MCIVYNIFNFKSLAAVFILRWHRAARIVEASGAAECPALDLILQARLVQVSPTSHERSDPVGTDSQPAPDERVPLRQCQVTALPSCACCYHMKLL